MNNNISNHCIVLDLDLTLLETQDELNEFLPIINNKNKLNPSLLQRFYHISTNEIYNDRIYHKKRKIPKYKLNDLIDYDFWGITRPFLDEFLIFCRKYFKRIIVWSAGKRNYVHSIVNKIFKNVGYEPDYIFTFDHIKFNKQGRVVKPLKIIINEINDPYVRLENCIFIDDTNSTFEENIDNAILIPKYETKGLLNNFNKIDECLKEIIEWLMKPEVINAYDIRKIYKKIFFDY